ncbi:MAG TPA: hypothetical protein DEQ43_19955, partial [Nocardioides bacterium]|nr:hypothetical protein [Nocardioides sp.]
PVERIERDARRDRWFTAEEAQEYGFVDAVLTDVAMVTPRRAEPVRMVAPVRQEGSR